MKFLQAIKNLTNNCKRRGSMSMSLEDILTPTSTVSGHSDSVSTTKTFAAKLLADDDTVTTNSLSNYVSRHYQRRCISARGNESDVDSSECSDQQFEQIEKILTPSSATSSSESSSVSQLLTTKTASSLVLTVTTRTMIAYYAREFFCILILIFTTYATYQNIPPKLSMIMPAKPFFPKGSFVHDWPTGQLSASKNRVAQNELSFVLFYAPWCAESQNVRYAYEYAARLFHYEAHFAAINCWHPGGECRHQYGKIMNWPVLMAYMQNDLAVSYTGRWKKESIVRFIRSILHPVQRITTPENLLELITSRDVVATLFVDLKYNQAAYNSFYRAAVRSIEKDPFQEVLYTTVTGQTAQKFGITKLPSVRLYLWNETLQFPNATWTHNQLTKWVENSAHQISTWLTLPGSKSLIFSSYLKRGPSLVLFTPRNLHHEFVDAYSLVRQLSLEYFNCPNYDANTEWKKKVARVFIQDQRHRNWHTFLKRRQYCQQTWHRSDTYKFYGDQYHENTIQSLPITISNAANLSNLIDAEYCFIRPVNKHYDSVCTSQTEINYPFEKYSKKTTIYEDSDNGVSDHTFETSMINSEVDGRAPKYLQKLFNRKYCQLSTLNAQLPSVFFNEQEQPDFDLISGIVCRTNRSLSFFVIDSDVYGAFAQRLGINIHQMVNDTVAFIVDEENESTYIRRSPITLSTLIKFIHNFLHGKLSRFLKKTDDVHVPIRKSVENTTSPATIPSTTQNKKTIEIINISTKNLMEKLNQRNQTIFVLFYSAQCALCGLLTHYLLHVSNILGNLPMIEFARIDGDQNDLPWQFTMDKFPLLVAFSTHDSKSESRVFPSALQVNTENILGFVLANLSRPLRLFGMIKVCQIFSKMKPFENCILVLRTEIMDNISYNLKRWRSRYGFRREAILRRLQLLQRIYLHTYRVIGNYDTIHWNILRRYAKSLLTISTTPV